MADDVARLVATLEANIKGFTKGMDQAAKVADRRFGQVERRLSQTEKRFAGAFRGLGRLVIGGGALIGIQRFVSHISEAAGKLQDTSDALGIGTDALQAWGILAGRAGIGQDQLNKSLGAFSARLGEAQLKGGDFAKFLNGIGAGTQGNAEDVFNRLADAVKNTASQQQRAAIVAEAFGAKAVKLTPIIQQGSAALRAQGLEFAKNGQIMTRESIAKIDELGDKWEDLKRQFTAIGGNVLAGFADSFSQFANELSSPAFQKSLQEFGRVMGEVAVIAAKLAPILPNILGAAAGARVGRIGGTPGMIVGGIVGGLAPELLETQKRNVQELEQELQRLKSTLASGFEPVSIGDIKALEEQIAALRKEANIPFAPKKPAPTGTAPTGGGIDRTGTLEKPETESGSGKSVAEREADLTIESLQQVEDAVKEMRQRAAEEHERIIQDGIDARNQGEINTREAVEGQVEEQKKADEEKKESQKKADDERVRNFDDTLSTIATLASNSNDTLAAIGKAAAIAQATIDGIVAVQKALASAPPPFNFALAALVGAATAANVAQIAGMEKGGRVQAGTPYIVGEKRPELFVPDTNGRIIPRLPNIASPTQGSRTLSMSFTNQNSFAGAVDANSIRAYAEQVGETSARSAVKTIQRQFPTLMVKAQRDRL